MLGCFTLVLQGLNRLSFAFPVGMTWQEFIESPYNPDISETFDLPQEAGLTGKVFQLQYGNISVPFNSLGAVWTWSPLAPLEWYYDPEEERWVTQTSTPVTPTDPIRRTYYTITD